ncbi:MAG: hypothetical protein AVDCRST_MAG14-698 [uncultured Rubrobacteraceae bacterium]|uniref:Uncharacterized protein n=1 Tax=uncultured Rubrobacteraceae bacterium TaxID=349277 RepID=A0A6J4QM85_9ACTN|nr:MAG: hypothetical protein AVDCRST_MAG14-698 [uncultured Rubrobacteraceae bacterium]
MLQRKLQRPTNGVLCRVGALVIEIAGEPDPGEQVSVVILDAAKLSRVEQ